MLLLGLDFETTGLDFENVLLIVGFKLPWWWHLIATIVWLLKQSARFVEKAQ